MPSIRLHPKHGFNATIKKCIWCGKEKNEIALLGASYKGEAPRSMALDNEPCDACRAQMARGITLIESTPDGKTTGRWCVITEDAFRRMFNRNREHMETVLKVRKACIGRELAERLELFKSIH